MNTSTTNATCSVDGLPKRPFIAMVALTSLLLACWAFPKFWYTQSSPTQKYFWLAEQTNLTGWVYESVPVDQSAEALLVADRLVNGEFNAAQQTVRIFSAKRYVEKSNEIGLFVHTPDRCWTQSGWQVEPTTPDLVNVEVRGTMIPFERRIFVGGTTRELVYFSGLTGGQPLPYRLDHNLGVGMRIRPSASAGDRGTALRASDTRLWARVWDSFLNRRQLLGPKQFIRLSTSIVGEDVASADALLQRFLNSWLTLTDFKEELASWVPPSKKS